MINDSLIRKSIWLTVPFNFLAAIAFAFPTGPIGSLVQLPIAPALYTAFLAFLVGLFGGMYVWIASQATICRPLLALGAVGKIGVFVIALLLYFASQATFGMVLAASGDLAFGAMWGVWLYRSSDSSNALNDDFK